MGAFKILLFSVAVILFTGCTKTDSGPIDNLRGGQIMVVGHAGLGFESLLTPYPSNTLTSIRKVIEGYNADGVEVDVQLTQDSVPVLYHDNTLETLTDCYGITLDYKADELLTCRYRTDFHSHILQNETITALQAIISRYAGSVYDPYIFLDLKFPEAAGMPDTAAYTGRVVRAINNLIETYSMNNRVIAEAGNLELLLALRAVNPNVDLMLDSNDFTTALATAEANQLQGIVILNDNVTKEQIKEAHRKGIEVVIFGVALRKDIVSAVNKHPDIIQADNVNLLQQILTK